MDLFAELKEYVTSYHPKIKLGSEELKEIKYSEVINNAQVEEEELKVVEINKSNGKAKQRKSKKIGRKKSESGLTNGRYSDDLNIPKKRNRNCLCPLCKWIFPPRYSEEEMNRHAEMCIEGKGSEDIQNYRSELKDAKKKKKVKRSKKKEVEDTNVLISRYLEEEEENLDDEEFEVCNYCELYIGELNPKFKEKHLMLCKQEQSICIKKFNLL